ncbi:unnamed protein product, partial [marine sediment metagenome]
DLKRMLLLMMDSLKAGEPVNDYWKPDLTWTFVNEEDEKDGCISGVGWRDYGRRRMVELRGSRAGRSRDLARFRASVIIDVPRF